MNRSTSTVVLPLCEMADVGYSARVGYWLSWQARQVTRDLDELAHDTAHDTEIRDRVLSGRRARMNSSGHSGTGPGFVKIRRRRRYDPAHLNWLDQRPQAAERR